MSELRRQLESAKSAYAELRYPGNLAAEVIFRDRPSQMLWWSVVAIAAAVLVFLVLGFLLVRKQAAPHQLAMTTSAPAESDELPSLSRLPGMPQLAVGLSIVPEPASITEISGMPMLPSYSEVQAEAEQPIPTTQETR